MYDLTNGIVDEETILRHLVMTACQKAKRGLDAEECARRASEEVIMGILLPNIREWEREE